MAVRLSGPDMELLASVTPVRVLDDPDLLQDPQRPVDRGGRRLRIQGTATIDELAASHVAVRPLDDLDDQPPLRGPAQARTTEVLADGIRGRRGW